MGRESQGAEREREIGLRGRHGECDRVREREREKLGGRERERRGWVQARGKIDRGERHVRERETGGEGQGEGQRESTLLVTSSYCENPLVATFRRLFGLHSGRI